MHRPDGQREAVQHAVAALVGGQRPAIPDLAAELVDPCMSGRRSPNMASSGLPSVCHSPTVNAHAGTSSSEPMPTTLQSCSVTSPAVLSRLDQRKKSTQN
jgi:hypothetical protein